MSAGNACTPASTVAFGLLTVQTDRKTDIGKKL
jgi:hypothetical protein